MIIGKGKLAGKGVYAGRISKKVRLSVGII